MGEKQLSHSDKNHKGHSDSLFFCVCDVQICCFTTQVKKQKKKWGTTSNQNSYQSWFQDDDEG